MNKVKIYTNLAGIAGLIGIGMMLGHSLSQGTSNTPLWIGGILILLSAVLIGMSISSRPPSNNSSSADKSE